MNEFIDAVLNLEWRELVALIDQVITNPLANVQMSLLFLIAVIVLGAAVTAAVRQIS